MDSWTGLWHWGLPFLATIFMFTGSLISAAILTVKRDRRLAPAWVLTGMISFLLLIELGHMILVQGGLIYEYSGGNELQLILALQLLRWLCWMMMGGCLFFFRSKKADLPVSAGEGYHG